MSIRLFLAFVLLSILSKDALATEQYSDILIYKGEEYILPVYYLEKYFEKYPDKKPNGIISTALWRGYVAVFEIKENQLF